MPYTYIQRAHRSGLGSRSSSGQQRERKRSRLDGCFNEGKGSRDQNKREKTQESCKDFLARATDQRERVTAGLFSKFSCRNSCSTNDAWLSLVVKSNFSNVNVFHRIVSLDEPETRVRECETLLIQVIKSDGRVTNGIFQNSLSPSLCLRLLPYLPRFPAFHGTSRAISVSQTKFPDLR